MGDADGMTSRGSSSINDLHPIELTAHSLLSGSLDNLNENFESLNQSQVILLTRLRIMEEKLTSFRKLVEAHVIDEKEFTIQHQKIKELTKRISAIVKQLDRIETRVDALQP
ncbi:uncharacterized protein LODBEIA_P54530 [Lodderomyces beijingensis]|uniref:Biogenesis of lysosome-related organelles complex 1 subunit CNL1 n=1 Tax=Lodderomyces beijingensis TaxID=1775926 RepID=A0ABP0ZSX0_9ASCO